MKRIVPILILALCAVGLQAATYYVATNGNDGNAGSEGSPWRTFGKGVTNVYAGDTLKVGAGYYNESFPLFTQRSGTAGNPIVLDGQGVANIKYLGIRHQYIYVINFGLSNNSSGAMIDMDQPAGHCVLSNNVFDNGYVAGINYCIKWTGPSGADLPFNNAASDCLVISNTLRNLAGDMTAISVFGDNNRIWGNSIYNVDNIDFFHVWGRTNLFYGNLCSNNWQSGLYGGHPDLVQSYGTAGQGGEANVFERNKFIHGYGYCQMGMYEGRTNPYLHDITFRNNYFVGISLQASMIYRDVRWYNNIFYRCFTNQNGAGNFGLLYGTDNNTNWTNWALSTGHGGHIVNNIFLGGGSLANPQERGHYSFDPTLTPGLSNILADYNYVGTLSYGPVLSNHAYHAVGSPDGWDVDLFWETNGINGGDLLMTDPANLDFRIPTNSPIYKRGTNLSWMFTTDHAGNTRPAVGNWTIGPLEAEAGAGPTAPTIDVQPQSVNIIPGQSATFSVTASGTGPLTYQWKLGGANISGATNSTYTTNVVRLAAKGNVYSVGVTNSIGGIESSNATMDVGVPYEEIVCRVNPRAIRAYTVALTNQIRIVWPTNEYRTDLYIGKRVYTNVVSRWNNWVTIYTNTSTPTAEGEYVDSSITNGIHYEYFVESRVTNWVCDGVTTNSPVADRIYINTGTHVPLKDTRGSVILLVENNLATLVPDEITTLTNDLIGDGYKVYRYDVESAQVDQPGWSNAVGTTKALIQSNYNTAPTENWTLFMLGHVPVPYSGTNSSPGSHTNNTGAMVADWYYGVMTNALWTDNRWNGSTWAQDYSHNTNLYYDGKWDQDYVPGIPELAIGRLDLTNMPLFGDEQLLTKRYLDREHQWRHKEFTAREKGIRLYSPYSAEPVVSDSMLTAVLGNATNNTYGTWLNYATNSEHSYIIADHGGTGFYTYDLTLGGNTNFLRTNLYTVFNMMYGSYYGDVDSGMHPNHILRSPLCSTGYCVMTLYRESRTMFNSFSMNETIGEQVRQDTGNNFASATAASPYYATYAGGSFGWHVRNNYAYVSIQGDPTLRLRVVYPPSSPLVTRSGSDLVVSWSASVDTNIVGYHVYRCPVGARNSMARLTTTPVYSPYTNTGAFGSPYDYMVRAVKLDEYTTRSFYNASQGVFASYTNVSESADVSINPESWTLSKLTNSTASSTNYVLSNSSLTNEVEYSNVVSGTWLFVSPAGGTFTNSATNTVTAYATNIVAGTYTNYVLTYSWTNNVLLETNTFTVIMTVTNGTAPAATNVYYVATTGSDSAAGTIDAPFLTIMKGVSMLSTGKTLYIRGGVYNEKVDVVTNGTAASPVTIAGYQSEKVVVDGEFTIPSTAWYSLFYVDGKFVVISNLTVSRSLWMGLTFVTNDCMAINVTSCSNMENGLLFHLRATNGLAEGCEVYYNCYSNTNFSNTRGDWASGLSAARGANNCTIRRNRSYNNWGEGLSTYESSNTVIEGNVIYDNQLNAYLSDTVGTMFRSNMVYSTENNVCSNYSIHYQIGIYMQDETALPASSDNTIVNNLVYGNAINFYIGFTNGGGLTRVTNAYNTYANSRASSEANVKLLTGSHANSVFKNNIVLQEGSIPVADVVTPSGITFSYNNWSKETDADASGSGDVVGDPLLAQTGPVTPGNMTPGWFALGAGSAAIGAAQAIGNVLVDFANVTRGSPPDIGALEYLEPVVSTNTFKSLQRGRSTIKGRVIFR